MKAEEYLDEDYKEIDAAENDTNLITKLNTPINILLLSAIFAVILMIIIVWFLF